MIMDNVRSSNLQWFDTANNLLREIDASITSISVNYSMDMCAQLTVQVHDPNFELTKANYFSVTRNVKYQSFAIQDFGASATQTPNDATIKRLTQTFEIAAAQVAAGPGVSPIWTLELRTKAIQQMKRDRSPGTIKGSNADFARNAADKYGLLYYMQNTQKNKQITKASSQNRGDSTWDVISRLASDAKFVTFETNGYLVFCSQKFLLGKWGINNGAFDYIDPQTNKLGKVNFNYIPVTWPRVESDVIQLLTLPSMRTSDNDPLEATGSIVVDRLNGTSLRPGMTIRLQGIPTFEKFYLISAVTYDHFGTDPVQVELRTPEREEKNILEYVVGAPSASSGAITLVGE